LPPLQYYVNFKLPQSYISQSAIAVYRSRCKFPAMDKYTFSSHHVSVRLCVDGGWLRVRESSVWQSLVTECRRCRKATKGRDSMGRHEWIRDEAFDDICDRFRDAILDNNSSIAIDMLCEITTASLHSRFVNFLALVSLDTTS